MAGSSTALACLLLAAGLQGQRLAATQLALLRQVPAWGFDNLLADWVYLRFLQYHGSRGARAATGYDLNPQYFRAIVERDPHFLAAYFYLSPATSLFAGKPQTSVALIGQRLQHIDTSRTPRACYLWVYRGTDQMLFLPGQQAAARSYRNAARCAQQHDSAQMHQLARSARDTARFLRTHPIGDRERANAWAGILRRAPDGATRQRAIRAIRAIERLGGEVTATAGGQLEVQLPPRGAAQRQQPAEPRR